MSGTERFNFNAKPGEPGYREVKTNKYGHTVLGEEHSRKASSSLDDKVVATIDPETGTPRIDASIWDTKEMKDLAVKYNMPLDAEGEIAEEPVKELTQHNGITDEDMDNLLTQINDEEFPVVVENTNPEERLVATNLPSSETRVRKIAKNEPEESENTVNSTTKLCSDPGCGTQLPADAKFCFSCGKMQKVMVFCISCGRKYLDQENFCSNCGCTRQ